MSKSMLVNVAAEEEYRVAVVDNGVLDLFEIETLSRENIKGNIFKAIVDGVNPALEAAFVDYGGERAAFLPLDEINFKIYPTRSEGSGKGRGSKIGKHLDKGMEVLVQVIRDAFANKPPTLSTYYSLPGRYLVLMPGADAAGISRKIEDEEQRGRLRRILDGLTIPEGFGVIVRTAGMETSPRELQADLDSLLELWRNIERAADDAKAPALIYQERDLVIRTARDHFTTDISEVLIDDEGTWKRLRKFFEAHMPERADVVRLYTGDKPIFSKYNLEEQIEQIYKRVVPLRSGGSISIDQTEALTAIDVNSARSARGGSSEETAHRTNLEAAEEIARQLRLRDIGGLIVIDFIDMESSRHVRQVERVFTQSMSRDKARYDVTRISKLGLMEVSRQRLKSTKSESSFSRCPTCSGDGMVRTPESAARAAFRKLQGRVARGDVAGVKVYLPPEVALYLLNRKRDDLQRIESRHHVEIEVIPQEQMKVDQFEVEEIRREVPDTAPMVSADVVDQAVAEGAFTPLTPPEPAPLPAQGTPAAATAPGDAGRHRRRRRRRGRGRGHGQEAASETLPAPQPHQRRGRPAEGRHHSHQAHQAPHAPAPPADSVDQPVFSEGPDAEALAPQPAAAADQQAAAPSDRNQEGRRRRRRRRGGRGRRHGQGAPDRPAGAPHGSEGHETHAPGGPAPGEGFAADAPRPEPPSRPRHHESHHVSEPHHQPEPAAANLSGGGEGSPPKRRWWRRAFKG